MAEQPTDFVLPLLREIRDKQDEFAKQVGALAAGQVSIRAEVKTTNDGMIELRADSRSMRDALHEVAIAIDGHSARLDRIEEHLGLNDHKH